MRITEQALDRLLATVEKPGRYVGQEWNAVAKDWESTPVRIALGYPDVYEIGMSNIGLAILYELVNEQEGYLAERFYTPWADMDSALRAAGLPLYALESRHALRDFDMVGLSLQHELTFSNVLTTLDLAGIPLLAQDRDDDDPLVMAGGSCGFNPEPMAAFFDLFVIGDGEVAILEIASAFEEAKRAASGQRLDRQALLERLAAIQGVYVPSLYDVAYAPDGTIAAMTPRSPAAPEQVTKALLPQLTASPSRPIVPTIRVIHDRGAVEIQRGCSHGCRFCQAGMIYRPIRERPTDETKALIGELIANTGYDEVGLVSLSSSDHSGISEIARDTMETYAARRLSVSLPSLRIDSFSVDLAKTIQQSRKTGFTFAPEAGSQRLRDVINKGVSEQDLMETAEAIFQAGWDRVKLYFMIGLPTETDEDILESARLINEIWHLGRRLRHGRATVKVTISTFVPKPFTPFQWEPMIDRQTVEARQRLLRENVHKTRNIQLSWSNWDATWLEGIFSRGDRRLGPVVLRAWQLGARFDAWHEHYRPAIWEQALAECGIEPAYYAHRRRAWDETLPWAFIDVGVTPAFLRREAERALRGELSPDCRRDCHHCGILKTYATERDAVSAGVWGCP